jgi:hypothetical protein
LQFAEKLLPALTLACDAVPWFEYFPMHLEDCTLSFLGVHGPVPVPGLLEPEDQGTMFPSKCQEPLTKQPASQL